MGRYYITAGRVDLPTYFPGTLDVSAGTVVAIAQRAETLNVDFVLRDESVGRATGGIRTATQGFNIPVQINIEGGGKVPVIAADRYPVLRLTPATGTAADYFFSTVSIFFPMPSASSPSWPSWRLWVRSSSGGDIAGPAR